MTDVIPDKTFLTTKRNSTRITDSEVKQVFVSEKIFDPGRIQMEQEGQTINENR